MRLSERRNSPGPLINIEQQTVALKLEQEFEAADQGPRFALLRGFLIGDAPTLSYGEIAARLELSESAVKSMVRRLRKRFGVVLRAEVAQTINRDEDVDEELRYLLRTLENR